MSKLTLITGATSGIGAAYAERYAALGHDLVVVGRCTDRLQAFVDAHPEVSVHAVTADLSTHEGVDAVSAICRTEPVDVLVNNAGVAHYGPLAELAEEKAAELVGIKALAPTMLTRAVLPGMLERDRGSITTAFGGQSPQLASRYRD